MSTVSNATTNTKKSAKQAKQSKQAKQPELINFATLPEFQIVPTNIDDARAFAKRLAEAIVLYDENAAARKAAEIAELLEQERKIKQRLAEINGVAQPAESDGSWAAIASREPSPQRTLVPVRKVVDEEDDDIIVTTDAIKTQMFFATTLVGNSHANKYAEDFSDAALSPGNVARLFAAAVNSDGANTWTKNLDQLVPYINKLLENSTIFDLREAADLTTTIMKLKCFVNKVHKQLLDKRNTRVLVRMLKENKTSGEIVELFVK